MEALVATLAVISLVELVFIVTYVKSSPVNVGRLVINKEESTGQYIALIDFADEVNTFIDEDEITLTICTEDSVLSIDEARL